MTERILLGDEAVALGAVDAGISAAYAYPGTPSTEIFQTIRRHAKIRRPADPRPVVDQREGRARRRRRRLVRRQARAGRDEARGPQRRRRPVHERRGRRARTAGSCSPSPTTRRCTARRTSRTRATSRTSRRFPASSRRTSRSATTSPARPSSCPRSCRCRCCCASSPVSPTAARRSPRRRPRAQNEARYVADPSRYTLHSVERPARLRRAARQAGRDGRTTPSAPGQCARRCAAKAARASWRAASHGTTCRKRSARRSSATTCCASASTRCRWARSAQLLDASTEVRVVEEGYPFIERYVSALGLMREPPIKGKLTGHLPRSGELTPGRAAAQLRPARSPTRCRFPASTTVLVGRPPRLCDACPHDDAYLAINEAIAGMGDDIRVMGDIGCYALGYLKPHQAIHSCLCMGASIGMAIGAAHAGMKPVAVRDRRRHVHPLRHGAAARRRAREHRHQGVHPRQQHRRDDGRPADDGDRRTGGRPGRRARRVARAHPRRRRRCRRRRPRTSASSARRSPTRGCRSSSPAAPASPTPRSSRSTAASARRRRHELRPRRLRRRRAGRAVDRLGRRPGGGRGRVSPEAAGGARHGAARRRGVGLRAHRPTPRSPAISFPTARPAWCCRSSRWRACATPGCCVPTAGSSPTSRR